MPRMLCYSQGGTEGSYIGVGDEILAAGQAQRVFDETGRKSFIVDKQLRARWHPIWEHNPVILQEGNREPSQLVQQIVNGPNARPYIIYPFTAESGWTFNRSFHARDHIARIYLTDAEKQLGIDTRRGGPFVLIEPYSKHANLRWPREHWQQLVVLLSRRGYRVVQHTHQSTDYVVEGIEYVLTHTFREACGVLNSASLYIRGESGMCHAAAALGIPQVTIWGECMDWYVLGGYPKQFGVGVGVEDPCGRYLPCTHCTETMYAIDPERVEIAALHQLGTYGLS